MRPSAAAPPATEEPSCASSMFGAARATRQSSSSSLPGTLFVWLRRILALPADAVDGKPARERRPSGEYAPTTSGAVNISVVSDDKPYFSPTKQRRTAGDPAAAPTATAVESLPPRKAAGRSPPTVVSSHKQQQQSHGRSPSDTSPTKKPPPPKKEVSMRSYVIGGLSFEVDARYKIKSIVGKGAYGLVCAAEDLCPSPKDEPSPKIAESGAAPAEESKPEKAAPAMVAVKKVIEPFHDHTDCKRLLREIRLLRCLRHPNVLHLTDIMPARSPAPSDWKDVYLVTRLFDTNLHRVIYSGHALTDAHIQYILWQIFRALRYLHAAGVVHRDMKPTNLLLNRDCELALADFGLARHMPHRAPDGSAAEAAHKTGEPLAQRASSGLSSRQSSSGDIAASAAPPPAERSKAKGGQLTKYVVTRWYRAPELLVQNRDYDYKVDMWSTGCILAEVLGAKAIFPGKDSLHQLRLVVEHLGLPSDEELSTIHNAQAVSYIRNLRPKEHAAADPAAAAQRFGRMYPHASPLLLDLLARLLQFDPKKRPTAAEALAHPYLAAYRDAPEEGLPTPEVEMNFEGDAPSTEDLRMLIWDEVLRYHPHLGSKEDAKPKRHSPTNGGAGAGMHI